ncbi:MAG: M48 family metallopeptidase [Selenomonadaceae bacterium]|nr:M48 family metallopeptidase [Selenomonadaceae bacterium]
MDEIKYEVIKSRRRTVRIEINNEGTVILRVPMRTTVKQTREMIEKNRSWIEKHTAIVQERQARANSLPPLTVDDISRLADRALAYIPGRVQHYAAILGVTYGRITIRNQKTKWGSCSVKGNLNFNCLLMLTPPEVIDAIVVHELCHRLEMNHSERFYAHVLRVYPEYRRWNKWLKEHGSEIMMRCHK